MQTEDRSADASNAMGRRRRRWPVVVVVVLVVLLIFVALLPHLASIGPVRDFLLRVALPQVKGSVHAGSAQLGWFSPIRFDDITVHSPDGELVASIDRLEGNRALWRLIFGSDLGDFRIERPRLNVVFDKNGSNLTRVFAGRKPDEKKSTKPPNVALGVKLIDGSVTVRGRDSAHPWTAGPINFAFRLTPSSANEDGLPYLEIEPGVLFADTRLTPEVCHDLLKYIAPVLADATEASGRFSLELDRWRFPMTDFDQGEGAGRLTIHEMNIGPGPLIHELATTLQMPPRLISIENEPITFRMADGRVYHDSFTFHLERLAVRTSGSVGVEDGSLDMVAELTLTGRPSADRPLLAALAKQTLRVPIRGTLSRPAIDRKAFIRSLTTSGAGVLDDLLKDEQIDLGKIFKAIQKGRQQRLKNRSNPQPDKSNSERKSPLRGLIRGVIDRTLGNPGQDDDRKP